MTRYGFNRPARVYSRSDVPNGVEDYRLGSRIYIPGAPSRKFEVVAGATPNSLILQETDVAGAPIYVAPTGSDGNQGTQASPLATLAAAFDQARHTGASKIYFAPGAYLQTGTPGQVIVYQPAPVTLIGPPMSVFATVTAAGGSTAGVIVLSAPLVAEAAEGYTVRCLTGNPANVNVQRTCRFNSISGLRVGHAFPAAVNAGDTFEVLANTAAITWDQPILFDLGGGYMDTLGMDWTYTGPDVPPARGLQFFQGRALFTACKMDLNGRGLVSPRDALVGFTGTRLTDPNFGNRSFGGVSGRIYRGAGQLVVETLEEGTFLLDGGLARRGRMICVGGGDLIIESSDLANSQAFCSRADLLMAGGSDEPVRARLEAPLFQDADGSISNFAANVVTIDSPAGFGVVSGDLPKSFKVSGSATPGNNGVFPITQVVTPNQIKYFNPNGVSPDAGPLSWEVQQRQVQFLGSDLEGETGTVVLEIGARAELDVCELEDSVGYGIIVDNGACLEATEVTGTTNTLEGFALRVGASAVLDAATSVTGYLGDGEVGATAGSYAGNLAPPAIVADAAQLCVVQTLA